MNLLLIALDTCRADHLGCYGYPKNTSPNIDRLATEGALFTNCFSQSNCTEPGYMTIHSGLYPLSHNIVAHRSKASPAPHVKLLSEILHENGYWTGSVSTLVAMHDWWTRGYDYCEYVGLGDTFGYQGGTSVPAKTTFAHVSRLLKESAHRKFFLFLHFWDPHTAYDPPEKYDVFYSGRNPRDPSNHSLDLYKKGVWRDMWDKIEQLSPRYKGVTDIEYVCALYDGEILHADDYVGRILSLLTDLRLADDTLVILTADHGETLSESNNFYLGSLGHFIHFHLYDPNIHIPLIFWNPGIVPTAVRPDAFVEQVDIVPTVLELLGIKTNLDFDGTSLTPIMLHPDKTVRDAIFTLECTYRKRWAIRTTDWKLIVALEQLQGIPRRELYYLPQDPKEMQNLAHVFPERADELENRLAGWSAETCDKRGMENPLLTQPLPERFGGAMLQLARKIFGQPSPPT